MITCCSCPNWCVLHSTRDPIVNLLDKAQMPETCICTFAEVGELRIHEDCPIHWRETPDE